jgi:WD40 repeat protein
VFLPFEIQGFLFEGVLCAAFSESDKHVFTGSQDRTIKVWDVASGMWSLHLSFYFLFYMVCLLLLEMNVARYYFKPYIKPILVYTN